MGGRRSHLGDAKGVLRLSPQEELTVKVLSTWLIYISFKFSFTLVDLVSPFLLVLDDGCWDVVESSQAGTLTSFIGTCPDPIRSCKIISNRFVIVVEPVTLPISIVLVAKYV
jgi:hypothetical protein